MSDFPDTNLAVELEEGWEPGIGRLTWMLDAARRRTLEKVEDISAEYEQEILDWRSGPWGNSVGTSLYHLALIESSWLYDEVLETSPPADIAALFPRDVREQDGILTPFTGESLAAHLQRLEACHVRLLATYRNITLDEYRRPRHLELYSVTPEWVLFHLMQHEAEHRSQFAESRSAAERALGLRN